MVLVKLQLSKEDIGILLNILNEVYNGFYIPNFENKIGPQSLVANLGSKVKNAKKAEASLLGLEKDEIRIIKNSFEEVLKAIDEWEFDTRVDCSKEYAVFLKDKFDSLLQTWILGN